MIVSIEDSRDYQADMVLATLLDDSLAPLHPTQTTTAASSFSSAPTTATDGAADGSARRPVAPAATSVRRLGQTGAQRREGSDGQEDGVRQTGSQRSGASRQEGAAVVFDDGQGAGVRQTGTQRQEGAVVFDDGHGYGVGQSGTQRQEGAADDNQGAGVGPMGTKRREGAAVVLDNNQGAGVGQWGQTGTQRGAPVVFDDEHEDNVRRGSRELETSRAARQGLGGNRYSVGRSAALPTSSSDPKVAFPSGSQFRHTKATLPTRSSAITPVSHTRSSATAPVSHIPSPPQDVELMDVDALAGEPQGSAAARLDLGMDDNDVMDALFGEENMDGGVTEGRGMIGFDGAQEGMHDSPRIQPLGKETAKEKIVGAPHL